MIAFLMLVASRLAGSCRSQQISMPDLILFSSSSGLIIREGRLDLCYRCKPFSTPIMKRIGVWFATSFYLSLIRFHSGRCGSSPSLAAITRQAACDRLL